MNIKTFITNSENLLNQTLECEMEYKKTETTNERSHIGDVEQHLINIHPDVEYQTFGGIGGAISDTSATVWDEMSQENKEAFVKAYFDSTEGIGYTVTRLSIGSCDFSSEDYTYVEEGDATLDSFDISHDKKAVFPLIKAAEKYNKLTILASPWSPPAYMKTNGDRIGGKLKEEYYTLWAKHFKKYIEACKENSIDIWGVTLQNEPRHHQMWESCVFSPEEEIKLLGLVGKQLKKSKVKILCYDHCRERVYERAKLIFEDKNGKYCDGIANHWYSGDHFGELKAFYSKHPDKFSFASEGCCAIPGSGINYDVDLAHAERYAHDIIGAFDNGLTHYCDWNILLNENNGPYHNREGRGCSADAPVYYDRNEQKLIFRLSYYYIGHISKFVKPGAKIIASSAYTNKIDTVSFKNPDGSVICVLLNTTDNPLEAIIRIEDNIKQLTLAPHSILTAIINK